MATATAVLCARAREIAEGSAPAGAAKQLLEAFAGVRAPADNADGWTCSISIDTMEDPVTLPCGHSFDRVNIAASFARGRMFMGQCPICKRTGPAELPPTNFALRDVLQELKRREAPAVDFEAALNALASKLLSGDALLTIAGNAEEIVRVMRGYAENAIVCAEAAKMLVEYTGGRGMFAEREATLAAVGTTISTRVADCVAAQVPQALVAAIGAHSVNAPMFEHACLALRNIARDEAGLPPVLAARAPTVVLDAMRANVRSADFAHYGSQALANIAFLPAGKQAAYGARAFSSIVEAMIEHGRAVNAAAFGCLALRRIAEGFPAAQQAAVDAGALAAVVAALETHAEVAIVAEQGCCALAIIADLPAGRQAAVDAGAPAAVVAAMNAHEGVAVVAEKGCLFLCIITILLTGQRAAVDAGAPAAIVSAMSEHEGVADVARNACWALSNITYLSAGVQAAVDAGAPARIIAAMHAHANNVDVAKQGCIALLRIAELTAGQSAIISAGGIAAFESATARHPAVKEIGTRALLMVTGPTGEARALAVLGNNGRDVSQIVRSMSEFENNAAVFVKAANALILALITVTVCE